jgi:hypothetical protein
MARHGTDVLLIFAMVGLFLTVITMGLALLVLLPLLALAPLAPFSAFPMGLLLAWSLGRVLQGRYRGPRLARGTLTLAAVGGILSAIPLAALFPPLGLVALTPLVARVLMGTAPSSAFLRGRGYRRGCGECRERPEVLDETGGTPCAACGTRVL